MAKKTTYFRLSYFCVLSNISIPVFEKICSAHFFLKRHEIFVQINTGFATSFQKSTCVLGQDNSTSKSHLVLADEPTALALHDTRVIFTRSQQ